MFIIVRSSDGKYLAGFGGAHSYTDRLQHAQRFATRVAAARHCCPENERVMSLDDAFTYPVEPQ